MIRFALGAGVDEARAAILNLTPIGPYADPALSTGTVIKRVHVTDLRNRVQ